MTSSTFSFPLCLHAIPLTTSLRWLVLAFPVLPAFFTATIAACESANNSTFCQFHPRSNPCDSSSHSVLCPFFPTCFPLLLSPAVGPLLPRPRICCHPNIWLHRPRTRPCRCSSAIPSSFSCPPCPLAPNPFLEVHLLTFPPPAILLLFCMDGNFKFATVREYHSFIFFFF